MHRNCNSIEGRILHWARRSGVDPLEFLQRIVQYVQQDWAHNPFHPNHKTPDEHQVTVLRRKLRRVKTPKKKQEIRAAIKELQK